jgi:hypothetical protein
MNPTPLNIFKFFESPVSRRWIRPTQVATFSGYFFSDNAKAGSGNTANLQGGVVKYGHLPDSAQNDRPFIFGPSFTARLIKEAIGETERATDGFISTAFKIPKILSDYRRIIPLATLLDSHSRGRDLGAVNESGMDDDGLRRRKGKKRRGLRL